MFMKMSAASALNSGRIARIPGGGIGVIGPASVAFPPFACAPENDGALLTMRNPHVL